MKYKIKKEQYMHCHDQFSIETKQMPQHPADVYHCLLLGIILPIDR